MNDDATTTAAVGGELACEVRGLQKRYGGVHALKGLDLAFAPGEVHAILGENGAGKSTFMKILAGAEQPDEGTVVLAGQERSFGSVRDANAAGIAIVFQELSLFPELDVLANLFANRQPGRFAIRRSEMRPRAKAVLESVGLGVGLDTEVAQLGLHDRQLLEIAKALLVDARVLILDEPTSALSTAEAERLFRVVRRLRADGVAVIFVSHRLEEIAAIADRVTVLRDGEHVKTVAMADTSMEQLVTDMIGRPPSEIPRIEPRGEVGDRALVVEGLSVRRRLHDVSFAAGEGEVVGLAGLEDAGVQDVMHAICGVIPRDGGSVRLPGGRDGPRSPTAAVRAGIALVPADRRRSGLMLEASVVDNLNHVTVGVTKQQGFVLNRRRMGAAAQVEIDRLRIKVGSPSTLVKNLSGGNQQKIVLGKWLQANPQVVLLDDPTRGVDLGAKLEIYRVIRELAERGCVVLFASSELEEYAHVCSRVLVMRRGHVIGEAAGDGVNKHQLLAAINSGTRTAVAA